MLKNTKKVLAILLAFVMLTSVLSGCSLFEKKPTKESLIGFAEQTIEDSESVDLGLDMVLDMEITEDGFKVPMEMDIEAEIQSHYDSETAYMSLQAKMNILGKDMSMSREAYIVEEDGDLVEYSKESEDGEDTGWYKDYSSGMDFDDPSGNIFESISDNLDAFELDEDTSNYDGNECYVLRGELDSSEEFLEGLDMEDLMGEFEYDEVKVDITAYFLKDSKLPYAVHLDMTDSFADAYETEASVEEFTMTLTFHSFNEIDEIKVPKSVKKEATEGDDIETPPEVEPPTEPVPDETEPDETKPEKDDDKPSVTPGNLSSDWEDFQFAIDGHVFTLPCTYQEIKEATGYTMKSSEEKSYLEPNYYTSVQLRDADGNAVCYIDVLNANDEDTTYADCMVIEISQDDYHTEYSDCVVEMMGLKVGETTSKADLVAMFGDYDDIYEYRIDEDDDQSWKKYENDTYTWCLDANWTTRDYFEIVVNISTGIIEEIRMDHSNGVE